MPLYPTQLHRLIDAGRLLTYLAQDRPYASDQVSPTARRLASATALEIDELILTLEADDARADTGYRQARRRRPCD